MAKEKRGLNLTARDSARTIVLQNLPNIHRMIIDGKTQKEIYESLGISKDAWFRAKKDFPEVQNVMDMAEQEQVSNVKVSLYMKAMGYYTMAEKVLSNRSIVQYRMYIPPDVNAQKFILLNKAPDEYKERQEITVAKKEYIIEIVDDEKAAAVDIEILEDDTAGQAKDSKS